VLQYADEMTRNVKVKDETFQKLRSVGFGEKDVVEITATVASYNMVSRFLVALDVGEQNGLRPDWAGKS
jgi:alkylhydroperoxidase family enzyme